MILLQTVDLCKRYGGLVATDQLSIEVRRGELHAIIGPNGAGKTSLINQLGGELDPTSGKILFMGDDITHHRPDERAQLGIARSYQITSLFSEMSVLENVVLAVQARKGHNFGCWAPAIKQRQLVEPAMAALASVHMEAFAKARVSSLAHGFRRQVELAMTLAMEPQVLLLDEPLAGMSHEESIEMTDVLSNLKGKYGVLLVEHDMDAVFKLADRISVLTYGKLLASGNVDFIRSHPGVKTAYLGDEELVS